ncbi:MAG: NnrU protein [Pseudomonadales bacterium]|nr:NnrU protein [Pseudomonadales bacterium]
MTEITLAALIWLGTHLGISSTPLRGVMVRAVGPTGFLGLYSLIATAAFVYLIYVYTEVPREVYFWLPNPDMFWVPKVMMPVALIFILGGFLVRNPTMVGAELEEEGAQELARGVTRITRHPLQWGVVLWAASHIVVNGDLVSIVFFSAFGLLSLAGGFLMDMKKAREFGAAWQAYAAVTSNIPFAAIFSGRNKLKLSELWLPVVIGAVGYAALWYFHESFTGTVIF